MIHNANFSHPSKNICSICSTLFVASFLFALAQLSDCIGNSVITVNIQYWYIPFSSNNNDILSEES